MSLYAEPRDPNLRDLVLAAVHDANDHVQTRVADNRFIGQYHDFPKLRWFDNGLPNIHHYGGPNPIDYGNPFARTAGEFGYVPYRDLPALGALFDYVLAEADLRSRIADKYGFRRMDDEMVEIGVALFALGILDRARHLTGPELLPEVLSGLYLEREAPLFGERLPVEILVPIAVTKFATTGRVQIGDFVHLEEMDEPTQLMRCYERGSGYTGVHDIVVEAATHALVLTGYDVPRTYAWNCHRLAFYPTDTIDLLLSALRLSYPSPTGYAQILMRPLGWADGWKAHLPPLIRGVTVRRYPPSFEEQGWLKQVSTVSEEAIGRTGDLFEKLRASDERVKLASRRLSSTQLRDRDDDALIDACIGLEALFGDRQGEVVHKLSIRVAALVSFSMVAAPISPAETMRAIRLIYDYRSRVVHGDPDAAKRAVFTADDGTEHAALELAASLLGLSINAVLEDPAYLKSGAIEARLLDSETRSGDA